MRRTSIPYRSTGRFAPLVLDYLDGDPLFEPLVTFRFDRQGLELAAAQRGFDAGSRQVLCSTLERQYTGVGIPPEVRRNLDALKKPSTLTISTGHQLCLFTGPLYCPFKILNVIRLAREMSAKDRAIVPVFWMASEDHDREEVDHAWIFGRKLHWPGDAGPPMGRAPLTGIGDVLDELDALLGEGPRADELRSIVRSSYRSGSTLAQATRLFVNALFGRFGLVTIDGDDPDLKRLFAPVMKEEALHQVVRNETAKADGVLRQRYEPQAHPREINLFHLSDRLRARIEKKDGTFRVLDGGTEYSTEVLLDTLDDRPQVFSPNVLLRPLYQETVLPNIAYVGGAAEIAYWLQLRPLFERFGLPMPVLVPRTSALLLSASDRTRMAELGLSTEDLFHPVDGIKMRLARAGSAVDTELSGERAELAAFYERLATRAKGIDLSLEATVKADAHKAANALDHLEQRLLRVAKRRQELPLQRLDKLHAHLFPDGALQERRDNFIPFYLALGPDFFDQLLEALDPMKKDFAVLDLDQ